MLKRKGHNLNRNYNLRKPNKTIFIFSEGKGTEVNYFEDKRNEISEIIRRNGIKIEVIGKGFNTKSLVEYVINFREKEGLGENDEYWVVFDKDNFEAFDSAILLANNNDIKVAYSNECFELWFLLHFSFLSSAVGRKLYEEKLTDIFLSLYNYKYDKLMEGIYTLIKEKEEDAIKYAKKLIIQHENEKKFSNKNPSTTVHLLVESLNSLKEESKN